MVPKSKIRTSFWIPRGLHKKFKAAVALMETGMSMSQVIEILIDDFLRNPPSVVRPLGTQSLAQAQSVSDNEADPFYISRDLHKRFKVATVEMETSMAHIVVSLIDDFVRNESPIARLLRNQFTNTQNSTDLNVSFGERT